MDNWLTNLASWLGCRFSQPEMAPKMGHVRANTVVVRFTCPEIKQPRLRRSLEHNGLHMRTAPVPGT